MAGREPYPLLDRPWRRLRNYLRPHLMWRWITGSRARSLKTPPLCVSLSVCVWATLTVKCVFDYIPPSDWWISSFASLTSCPALHLLPTLLLWFAFIFLLLLLVLLPVSSLTSSLYLRLTCCHSPPLPVPPPLPSLCFTSINAVLPDVCLFVIAVFVIVSFF